MKTNQDLRIIKTYMALYNTFTHMLEESPFEDITVGELCKRAMVRRATFYTHFADKYDFFKFYLLKTCDYFKEHSSPSSKNENIQVYVARMTHELIAFMVEHEKMVQRFLESNMISALLDMMSEQIVADIQEKLNEVFEAGQSLPVPLEVMASFYAGGLLQTLRWWFAQKERVPEQTLTRMILQISNFT